MISKEEWWIITFAWGTLSQRRRRLNSFERLKQQQQQQQNAESSKSSLEERKVYAKYLKQMNNKEFIKEVWKITSTMSTEYLVGSSGT